MLLVVVAAAGIGFFVGSLPGALIGAGIVVAILVARFLLARWEDRPG